MCCSAHDKQEFNYEGWVFEHNHDCHGVRPEGGFWCTPDFPICFKPIENVRRVDCPKCLDKMPSILREIQPVLDTPIRPIRQIRPLARQSYL